MSRRAERFSSPSDTNKKRRDRKRYCTEVIKREHRSRDKANHRIPHRNYLTENPFTEDYLYLDDKSREILCEEFMSHYLECDKKFEERLSKVNTLFSPDEDYNWCLNDPRYDYVYSGLFDGFYDYYVAFGFSLIQPPIVFFC
jgi:hypothetical protein